MESPMKYSAFRVIEKVAGLQDGFPSHSYRLHLPLTCGSESEHFGAKSSQLLRGLLWLSLGHQSLQHALLSLLRSLTTTNRNHHALQRGIRESTLPLSSSLSSPLHSSTALPQGKPFPPLCLRAI